VVVQGDLLLRDTPHSRALDTFVQHVEDMQEGARVCLTCHHEEPVRGVIDHFYQRIRQYEKKLSRVITMRAARERLRSEKESAFDLGRDILSEVGSIVIASAHQTPKRILLARHDIERTMRLLYGLMVLGPVILICTVFYFTRSFTRSVFTLTAATRKLKDGELGYRISNTLKDEFRELGNAFNEMAISLKEQQRKCKVAERLAAVGEIAAGLAHEVKNPLAGIKVSIEVLKSELDLKQEDKEIFLRIINEINRIEALLKNMLNYARPSKPRSDSVSLQEILEPIIKTSEFSLRSPNDKSHFTKEIDFVRDFEPDTPKIYADPGQLLQIFLNLILNAVDSIAEKGTITVKTSRIPGGFVQILIADTGKGIDPELGETIFKPFFTTKSKGTGLGLAISKRLVEQHNGTISVSSNQEGGATFVITLPEKFENQEFVL
jgi:signal transduction histidine kinase